MTKWTADELGRAEATDELSVASRRPDGTLSSPRTIWVVRYGDDLYIRSVNGRESDWFRGTQRRHEGHIDVGGVSKDVTFADSAHDLDDQIDAAYRDKYRRYAKNIVDSIVSPRARETTLRIDPVATLCKRL